MDSRLMFLPVPAIVALNIAVWLGMFFTGVGEIRGKRILIGLLRG